eukprot:CAMPEP_0197002342 /NCGR_PEP_ID=MMETSP1380-20130617/6858_1 /TAXON_ID=5936 /ORGANISM="Euplotes crassus, Strain CT5" /LENGTH=110 /DNA_ID=CAMNT_0042420421 /DNA_START=10 /DNA_END=342 /DNA_ORIENTATION=-
MSTTFNTKLSMSPAQAQELIDDATKFSEYENSMKEFITREKYTEIKKENFMNFVKMLLSSFGFKPTWSDYCSLWGTYETELGTREDNMEDPQTLVKYTKDLVQEYVWLHS